MIGAPVAAAHEQPAQWPARPQPAPAGLELTDLLLDLEDAVGLLGDQLHGAGRLDAFLLAALASQILADHRLPGAMWRARARTHLGKAASAPRRAVAAALSGVDAVVEGCRSVPTRACRVDDIHRALVGLTGSLAAAVLTGGAPMPGGRAAALVMEEIRDGVRCLPPGMRQAIGRLPSSFRSFDQHPDDVVELVGRFAATTGERRRPIVAVGVRTSGAYLAPLAAAALESAGFEDVSWITLRPGMPPTGHDRDVLAGAAAQATALVVDDPPTSGASVVATVNALRSWGFEADRIVLLLAVLNEDGSLPASLAHSRSITLPWPEWSLQRRLGEEAVAGALARLLPDGWSVAGVERRSPPPAARRGHVACRYRVSLSGPVASAQRQLELAVEGAGMGYLGAHAVAVARALDGWVPEVLGIADGLLYRAWSPATGDGFPPAEVAAGYVVDRHRHLPAAADRSGRLGGCQPVWEVAAGILSRAFGRAGTLLRDPLVSRSVRSLLAVEDPSIVDGRMSAGTWLATPAGAVKVSFAEGAFSNYDLACYDPVFDLAGAAVTALTAGDPVADPGGPGVLREPGEPAGPGVLREPGEPGEPAGPGAATAPPAVMGRPGWALPRTPEPPTAEALSYQRELRASFERSTGRVVDEERWLLYQLVELWNRERLDQLPRWQARLEQAAAVQRYLAACYLDDLEVSADGPLCALDIDGVLECETFGFPASTTAGMMAVRGLHAHGYRPVVVTGRSVTEVRQRCRAYRLPGGVAEYGAAYYDHRRGEVVRLTSAGADRRVGALRSVLAGQGDLEIDPSYRHILRVRRLDGRGRRGPVPTATLARIAPEVTDPLLWRVIHGDGQSDVIPAGVDKGTGAVALAALLNPSQPRGDRPLRLAVGDTASDLPLFAQAASAFAVANASAAVRASSTPLVGRAYQAGLADAVGRLLGHAPGGCARCRPPELGDGAKQLLGLLSVQEAGHSGMAVRAAAIGAGRLAGARRGRGRR